MIWLYIMSPYVHTPRDGWGKSHLRTSWVTYFMWLVISMRVTLVSGRPFACCRLPSKVLLKSNIVWQCVKKHGIVDWWLPVTAIGMSVLQWPLLYHMQTVQEWHAEKLSRPVPLHVHRTIIRFWVSLNYRYIHGSTIVMVHVRTCVEEPKSWTLVFSEWFVCHITKVFAILIFTVWSVE